MNDSHRDRSRRSSRPSATAITRRSLLAGAASTIALAACSSGKSAAPATAANSAGRPEFALIGFSDDSALVAGQPQRFPFGIADKDGVIVTHSPVASLDFTVVLDGQPLGAPISVAAHSQDLLRPYFPLVFTPPTPGVYTVRTQVNGTPVEANVQIPPSTAVVGAGQKMVPVDTATFTDPHGVELVCTRQPACALHDVTLRDALAAGTPVALIIATPRFCQTAICGPVLDVLLAQTNQFPTIKMLHAEVYPSEAAAQPGTQQLTEVVKAYGLTFEPVLYLAGPDGTIVRRIDTIFDTAELRQALAKLAG